MKYYGKINSLVKNYYIPCRLLFKYKIKLLEYKILIQYLIIIVLAVI